MPHAHTSKTILVCNCQRTMEIDGTALGQALGCGDLSVHTSLCRAQTGTFEQVVSQPGEVLVACTQEAALFEEIASEKAAPATLSFANIRERAGWSRAEDARSRINVQAKMAALLAEAMHVAKPAGLMTLKSEGQCLVYGEGQAAIDAAAELSSRLSVTVLMTDAADVPPPPARGLVIAKGRIRRLKGVLGRFELEVEGYAPALPSSRGTLQFEMPRNGARSTCDIILDVSGGQPLVPDGARRDGYVRADPGSPVAVAKALLKVTDLVGEFEKPLYVTYDGGICAHARNQKIGCSRCLDSCPTGAIEPDGDHVLVDPAICGGCGMCSAVCPTGAISYAYPRRDDVAERARILLETYRTAAGTRPVLLLHDESHGDGVISALARFGRGLPAHVLPLKINSVMSLGHDVMAALLALGAEQVVILVPPDRPEEMPPLESQRDLMAAFLDGLGYTGDRVVLICERDPEAVDALLRAPNAPGALAAHAFSAGPGKRDLARVALSKLWEAAPSRTDVIPLPNGAPYGRISIRSEGCTLCLACVGACPANALADNPDRPQVSFTEAACVQCGLCVATCPEKVITIEPRYDFTAAALTPRILHGEEPFLCVRCSKPFGTQSSILRVTERLKSHAMFKGADQLALIQMCDTCRIETLAARSDDPLRSADRPRVRTTEDYLAAEAEAKKTGRKPEDFLS